MKQNIYFIVLLFISHHTCSTAQVKTNQTINNKTTELENTRQKTPGVQSQGKYVRVSDWVDNPSTESPSIQTPLGQVNQKVKNVVIQEKEQMAGSPLLKEVSNSYWRTQAEIKTAKSQNNLVLLEELEDNSLTYRLNYISLYESIDPSNMGVEQVKLYYSFKKDFENE
ncbi:hypothetical protein OAK92_00295 [Crocinitomicaceae bacterium]|nr:hypothetical protein [Crocinitomicaceae bacterium]